MGRALPDRAPRRGRPAAMGQRLVRAKAKIREAGIPFRVPEREELPARLDAVLEAIYAAFAGGWSDPGGTGLSSAATSRQKATYLGPGWWPSCMPDEPEALGLLALMLHAAGAGAAPAAPRAGEFVPFAGAGSGRRGSGG